MPPIKKAKKQQKRKSSRANRLNYVLTAAIAATMVLSSVFVFGGVGTTPANTVVTPTIRITDTAVPPVLTNGTPQITVTAAVTGTAAVTPTP